MERIVDKLNPLFAKLKQFNKPQLPTHELQLSLALTNFTRVYTRPLETIQLRINDSLSCRLKHEYRLIMWLIYLNILPINEPSSWKNIIDEYRADYFINKSQYITTQIDSFIKTTQSKGSDEYEQLKSALPSSQDAEVLALIKLDVDRTYQELELFQRQQTKSILISVLYLYYKLHSNNTNYVQGMNELCGMMYMVFHPMHKISMTFPKDNISFLFYLIHSNDGVIEADVYTAFRSIMNKDMKTLYTYNNREYRNTSISMKTSQEQALVTLDEISHSNESPLKKRVYKLYYHDLMKINNKIARNVIGKCEPDYFMLRWLLCLFTREFTVEKCLMIWDAVLCYEFIEFHYGRSRRRASNEVVHLTFANCVCLSMIINEKKKISPTKDADELLNILMHYNENASIEDIVYKAITISEELNFNLLKEMKVKLK